MLFDYLLIALVVSLIFTTAWVTIVFMVLYATENRFFSLMAKADKAIDEGDFEQATYYNEKLSSIAKFMDRLENLFYFKFF